MESLASRLTDWAQAHLPNAIRIVVILAAALLLARAAGAVIRRIELRVEDDDPDTLSDAEKRARTLGRILRQVVTIAIWTLAMVTILSELGVAVGPLLAGAGIAGVAVGFGAQSLVKDVIAGFFLLFENQLRVGDVVSLAGVTGQVEALSLRTTILRDAEGTVHVVPNGAIQVVSNRTRGWSRALLDVGVAYREDTDQCFEILRQIGAEIEKDPVFGGKLLEPCEYPGVESLGESAVVLRMMVRTRPGEQWSVARELRRRIKKTFEEHAIEIPFPHRTLYIHPGDDDESKTLDPADLLS